MSEETSLPSVRAIGFFAAAQPADRAALDAALKSQLQDLRAADAHLLAVSPLAGSADLSFAAQALEAGVPLILLLLAAPDKLPVLFPENEHAEVREILQKAASIEVIHSSFSEISTTIHLAQHLVDQINVLIVLRESEQAGAGAKMITYANQRGRLAIALNSTPDGIEAHPIGISHDAAREEGIEALAEILGPPPPEPVIPPEVLRYFKACDDAADQAAPKVRRYVLAIVLANAAASISEGIRLSLHPGHDVNLALTVIKVVGIVLGLGIFVMLRRRESQSRWLKFRLQAEICRSMEATWNYPRLVEPFRGDELPEMRELIRSLHYLRITRPQPTEISFDEFKAHYGHRRLVDQYKYFQKQCEAAKHAAAWATPLYWIFSGGALLIGGVAMVVQTLVTFGPWLTLLFIIFPLAAPILASCVLAWQAIASVSRRKVRYAEMARLMRQELIDLIHCQSWEAAHQVVERAEKVLLNEVLEWYSFVKLK